MVFFFRAFRARLCAGVSFRLGLAIGRACLNNMLLVEVSSFASSLLFFENHRGRTTGFSRAPTSYEAVVSPAEFMTR